MTLTWVIYLALWKHPIHDRDAGFNEPTGPSLGSEVSTIPALVLFGGGGWKQLTKVGCARGARSIKL